MSPSASRVRVGPTCACSPSDVGAALSCGAHLIALRRTAIGPYLVDDAVAPDRAGEPLPIDAAVGHLPRLDLDADEAVAASHGRTARPRRPAGPYGVFGPDGLLIGVYEDDGPRARPQVILASADRYPPSPMDIVTGSRRPSSAHRPLGRHGRVLRRCASRPPGGHPPDRRGGEGAGRAERRGDLRSTSPRDRSRRGRSHAC